MKKILGYILVLCMLFSISISAFADNTTKEKNIKLNLGTTAAADDLQTQALQLFADNVKEKSNGSIQITVYPASMLGDATAEFDSTIAGTQDMFMESESGYLDQYGVPEATTLILGTAMTFDQAKTFAESKFMNDCREKFLEKNGLRTLSYNWYRNPIMIASKTLLKSPDDFKGIKLRVVPTEQVIKTYAALGFSPTSISYNEVYLALSQGVVDATLCPFDGYYKMKFYEVAPYALYFGNITNNALWMNEDKYEQLSDNQKAILSECANEAGLWYTESAAAVRQSYIDECEKAGCTFTEFSDELLNAAIEVYRGVGAELEEAGVMPKGTLEKAINASLGIE